MKFNLSKIRKELEVIEKINGWNDMTEESPLVKDLIKGRQRLIECFQDENGTYSKYKQILLTEFNSKRATLETNQPCATTKGISYRMDIKKADPRLNESNYNKPRWFLEMAPELTRLLQSFRAPVMRARFSNLKKGGRIKPHIDYDVSYGVRLHLAVTTNAECHLGVRKNPKDKFQEFHIPSDGFLYFVNVGYEHYARNTGETDRIHLVVGLDGTQDLMWN